MLSDSGVFAIVTSLNELSVFNLISLHLLNYRLLYNLDVHVLYCCPYLPSDSIQCFGSYIAFLFPKKNAFLSCAQIDNDK